MKRDFLLLRILKYKEVRKVLFLLCILCVAQNSFARWPLDTWWFIFFKETFISEHKSHTKELFSAVKNNDIETALSALENGANINARDRKGKTPLHWAVYMEYLAMAEFLLKKGADPDAINRRRRTPLHWAVLKADERFTRLLLEYNANPNIQDKRNRTPLHWLTFKPNNSLKRVSLSQQLNVSTPEHISDPPPIYWDKSDLVKIKLLLEHQANPNLKDSDQSRTPLHIAVLSERLEAVELLIKANANVNIQDYAEDTPLHFLTKKKKVGSDAVIIAQILLENGADPNALNVARVTPTHFTEMYQHTELYNLLHNEYGGQPKKYNACMKAFRTLKTKISHTRL